MTWTKLGNIFSPEEHGLISHAQVPTVHVSPEGICVYFSSRNEEGKSLPYRAVFHLDDPTKLIEFSQAPIMDFGQPGTFDDDGVMPSAIVEQKGDLLMYYSGWNQRVKTPYHNATGLARSTDGGKTFNRVYEGPVMDRTPTEPYVAVTPSLLKEESIWKIWYVSGIRWKLIEDKYEPIYVIKYATSDDGIHWERPPGICIKQHHDEEAFSHPSVIKMNGQYHMWYCYRGSRDYRDGANSYRMGYAISDNGIEWERQDNQNIISPSEDGWDSKMVCYPFVFILRDQLYMVYNGNGFGTSGFGLAKWKEQ